MKKLLLIGGAVLGLVLLGVQEARAYYPRGMSRNGGMSRYGRPARNHSSYGGYSTAGRGLTAPAQTIQAPRPGWYFPGLGNMDVDGPAWKAPRSAERHHPY